MALINCPECNREVSDKADTCPNCGLGVAKYIERQNKILKIQEEAEREAYLYVKRKKKEEKERVEQRKREEENKKNSIYDEAVSKYASESSTDVMKAEELFSTILGWKDSDAYLNRCKNRIDKLKHQEIDRKKKKKKNIKIGIITTTFIFIAIIIPVSINTYKLYQERQRIIIARNEFVNSIQGEYVYVYEIMGDTFHSELTVSGENVKIGNTPGTIQEVDGDIFYVEWTYIGGSTKKERFKRIKNGDGYNLIYSDSFLREDQEYIKQ